MGCRRAGAKRIAKGGTVHRIRRASRKGGSGPEGRFRRARRESLPSRPLPRKKSAPFLRGGGIFFVPGRIPSDARTPRTTPTGGPWRSGAPPGREASSRPLLRLPPYTPGLRTGPGPHPSDSVSGPSGAQGFSTSFFSCVGVRSSPGKPPPSWGGAISFFACGTCGKLPLGRGAEGTGGLRRRAFPAKRRRSPGFGASFRAKTPSLPRGRPSRTCGWGWAFSGRPFTRSVSLNSRPSPPRRSLSRPS